MNDNQKQLSSLPDWSRALGQPSCRGEIKSRASDFKVYENLNVELSGSGEHIWLKLRKRKQNTEQVAKALARHANIPYRDVSYSGLKDYHAVTEQWFSLRKPDRSEVDWQKFEIAGVELLQVGRHSRKLKRGSHSSNRFEIIIRQLEGDLTELESRLSMVKVLGVPNYFGEQRFGREGANVKKAQLFFSGEMRVKDRALRAMLISAARSYLFNNCLSERVNQLSWSTTTPGEPVNLNGSNSFFNADENTNIDPRLAQLDIHPTCALWGKGYRDAQDNYPKVHCQELEIAEKTPELLEGLEKAGLNLERRATRIAIPDLSWQFADESLLLEFELSKGQYATSVLREIVEC